jgi:DNA-binding GntR family transcriptional regulator
MSSILAVNSLPIETSSLRHLVYERIEQMIITGQLKPGDRMPETELAQTLGVSRGPIREALLLLERDGWLEVKPRHGATVRRRTDPEIKELYDTRKVLQVHSARLAAEFADEAARERAVVLLEDLRKATKSPDVKVLMAANSAIHDFIPYMGGTQTIGDLCRSFSRRLRYYTLTPRTPKRAPEVAEEHRQILEAILERSITKAGDLMRYHIERNWNAYCEGRLEREGAQWE